MNVTETDINNALGTFLQRAQLQGAEVPVYAQCMQYLAEKREELAAATNPDAE